MPAKSTTKDFIKKATAKHGKKYLYDKVQYVNTDTKIQIYCNTHKKYFSQTPDSHLRGSGCPACGGNVKLTTEGFIKEAKKVHGKKYGYDKVQCVNIHTKVQIYCNTHKKYFSQTPDSHRRGSGCPACGGKVKLTIEGFIKEAKKVHGKKYGYDKVQCVNIHTKVQIYCNTHKKYFSQTPDSHRRGSGCPACGGKVKLTIEGFIKEAKKVHGKKYGYDKVQYVNIHTKVQIYCNTHKKYFSQTPNQHRMGSGCPACGRDKITEACKIYTESKIRSLIKELNEKCGLGIFKQSTLVHHIKSGYLKEEHGIDIGLGFLDVLPPSGGYYRVVSETLGIEESYLRKSIGAGGRSNPEIFIYEILKEMTPLTVKHSVRQIVPNNSRLSVDIAIYDLNNILLKVIEIDGTYWHKPDNSNDKMKDKHFGRKMLRIEWPYSNITEDNILKTLKKISKSVGKEFRIKDKYKDCLISKKTFAKIYKIASKKLLDNSTEEIIQYLHKGNSIRKTGEVFGIREHKVRSIINSLPETERLELQEIRNNIPKTLGKKYTIYKDNKEVSISNLTQYCKDNNLSVSGLRSIVGGRQKSSQGYTALPESKLKKVKLVKY